MKRTHAALLTALLIPAFVAALAVLLGVSMLLHTDLFWTVMKWALAAVLVVAVGAGIVAGHVEFYRFAMRGFKAAPEPAPIDISIGCTREEFAEQMKLDNAPQDVASE